MKKRLQDYVESQSEPMNRQSGDKFDLSEVTRLHHVELVTLEEVARRVGVSMNELETQMIIADLERISPDEIRRRRHQKEALGPYAEAIVSMHGYELLPVSAISLQLGVSQARVEMYLRGLDLLKSNSELRYLREEREVREYWDRIHDALIRTRSKEATATELGVAPGVIQTAMNLGVVPDISVLLKLPRKKEKLYSDIELLQYLRNAAEWTGEVLTTNGYDKYAELFPLQQNGKRTPTKQTPINRFGGWGAALRRAGLDANPPGGPQKRFDSAAEAVRAVTECWRSLGRPPSVQAYDDWQRGKVDIPSGATVRKLIDGSWDALQLQAWQEVHGIVLDQRDAEASLPKSILDGLEPENRENNLLSEYSYATVLPTVTGEELHSSDRYIELERAVQGHMRIQDAVAREGAQCGLHPQSPVNEAPRFDLAFILDKGSLVLVEVKSATPVNLEHQLRIAVGQVLRYTRQMRDRGFVIRPCIAIELEPEETWRSLLDELGIALLVEHTLPNDMKLLVSTLVHEE